jgi:hypothetical protein
MMPVTDVGDYALLTPQSTLSVRGNIFTEITIQSQNPPDTVEQTMIQDMLKRFDEYITDKMVTSDKVRRPNMEISGTVPDTVLDNNNFDVKMADHRFIPHFGMSCTRKITAERLWYEEV